MNAPGWLRMCGRASGTAWSGRFLPTRMLSRSVMCATWSRTVQPGHPVARIARSSSSASASTPTFETTSAYAVRKPRAVLIFPLSIDVQPIASPQSIAMRAADAGAAAAMTAVNSSGFPAPAGVYAVPVVLAPLSGRLHVLLVQRAEAPFAGRWVLPGGFMSPTERPEQTAQRKLTEKTGVGAVYMEQLQTYGDPARDPRGWIPSVAYLGLIDATVLREEQSGARWVPVDDLPDLAFDHAAVIRDG